ncbi:MAG TPA: tetratricopeptide repeat protein, partial [Urbifossiella sp.]
LRDRNPEVSFATESIIRKCLAGNAADRYQKAEHLSEDLNRQLSGLPLRHAANPSHRERLRKWARRHPRITSSTTVAAVAGVLLMIVGTGAVVARERAQDFHALGQFSEHQKSFDNAQLFFDDRNQSAANREEALSKFRSLLERYGVNEAGGSEWLEMEEVRRLPPGERDRLRGDIGETFYLMAEMALVQASATEPGSVDRLEQLDRVERWHANAHRLATERIPEALRSQRQILHDLREGRIAEQKTEQFDIAKVDSPRDLFLLGSRYTQTGEYFLGLRFLRKATQINPHNFSAWFVRGTTHLAVGQNELAALCFSSCIAIRSSFAPAWLNRGRSFQAFRFFELALADYDRAIAIDPNLAEAYIQRASVRIALNDPTGAEADFTKALDLGSSTVRVYFLRADLRRRHGKTKEADADVQEGLKLKPTDELSWIGRAEMRLETNPTGALEDVEEALKINPFSMYALQEKAHILSERLKKPEEAMAVLDRAVKYHPDHVPLRVGRGVLLARAGKREAAHRDARDTLRRDNLAPNQYQVGCIYALTAAGHPEDKDEAIRLLWASLKTGYGMDIVDGDTDLDSLRKDRGFKEMLADAKLIDISRKK